jgi:hypothetical protein
MRLANEFDSLNFLAAVFTLHHFLSILLIQAMNFSHALGTARQQRTQDLGRMEVTPI